MSLQCTVVNNRFGHCVQIWPLTCLGSAWHAMHGLGRLVSQSKIGVLNCLQRRYNKFKKKKTTVKLQFYSYLKFIVKLRGYD